MLSNTKKANKEVEDLIRTWRNLRLSKLNCNKCAYNEEEITDCQSCHEEGMDNKIMKMENEIAIVGGALGVLVGGGGLFYPANAHSRQNISGWQWIVHEEHIRKLRPPLMLFAVGWNEFRGQGPPPQAQQSSNATAVTVEPRL